MPSEKAFLDVVIMDKIGFYTFCFEVVLRAKGLSHNYFHIYGTGESGQLSRTDCLQVVETLYAVEMDSISLEKTQHHFEELLRQISGEELTFETIERIIVTLQLKAEGFSW